MAITHATMKSALKTMCDGSMSSFPLSELALRLNCSIAELKAYISTQTTSFGLIYAKGSAETIIDPTFVYSFNLEDERLDLVEEDVSDITESIVAINEILPETGTPIVEQTYATVKSGKDKDNEITWTAEEVGEEGNGIEINIELSAEADSIEISVDGNEINILVEATLVEDELTTEITATDVLTAVNAHETAGALVQGELTGDGGTISSDSVITEGGLDITEASIGKVLFDETKLWISVDNSTPTQSHWKSITFDVE